MLPLVVGTVHKLYIYIYSYLHYTHYSIFNIHILFQNKDLFWAQNPN